MNKIKALKLGDGLWCYDENRVKNEVVGFFNNCTQNPNPLGMCTRLEMLFPLWTRI